MNFVHIVIILVFFGVSFTHAEIDITDITQAPRHLSIGMAKNELMDQKDGLFPGPAVIAEGVEISFETFMEIEGMGSPGHRSFYYLFENGKLQGVIHTVSLSGLDKDTVIDISASNYQRVLKNVSTQPESAEILRKDQEGFSKVVLEKWSADNGAVNLFHVVTNYESSVGVISSDTNFPTTQLFVSAEDQRFKGQIRKNATIIDTSREELRKVISLKTSDLKNEYLSSDLINKKGGIIMNEKNRVEGKSLFLVWMIVISMLLGGVYIFWKNSNDEG